MKSYCPACAIEVEYEGTGDNASCNICGQTKTAAKQAILFRKKQKSEAKLQRIWIAVGIVGAIAAIVFYISTGRSKSIEYALGKALGESVILIILFGLYWLFTKVKKWLQRRSDKQT